MMGFETGYLYDFFMGSNEDTDDSRKENILFIQN